jgi:cytochrome b6-f complex iron-sulfur subunit
MQGHAVTASPMISIVKQPLARRHFIRYAVFGIFGAFTAASSVATYRLLYPTKVTGFGAKIAAGTVADIKNDLATRKYIRNATGNFYLLPAIEGGAIAVYWRCVHLGCTVPAPNPDIGGNIQCPCHGSLYNGKTGDLIHGPATRPLDYFPISVENGAVIVDTGKVTARQGFDPSQAVTLQ